jgi:hypothetical protein
MRRPFSRENTKPFGSRVAHFPELGCFDPFMENIATLADWERILATCAVD